MPIHSNRTIWPSKKKNHPSQTVHTDLPLRKFSVCVCPWDSGLEVAAPASKRHNKKPQVVTNRWTGKKDHQPPALDLEVEHTHPSAALESRAEALGTYHSNVFQAKTDGSDLVWKNHSGWGYGYDLDLVIDPSLGRNVNRIDSGLIEHDWKHLVLPNSSDVKVIKTTWPLTLSHARPGRHWQTPRAAWRSTRKVEKDQIVHQLSTLLFTIATGA